MVENQKDNKVISKGVSVVVCCYNSAPRLPETLMHLFAQIVNPDINWEIIIINNASTDNTLEVAQATYKALNSKTPFKIIPEEKPGLSYARIAGLNNSEYEYIIWVDDDNWLQPGYVNTAFELMDANSQIGILGGIGLPELEVKAPEWFEAYKLTYATGKQANQAGEIQNYGFLYGAGVIIRKSGWLKIINGGFKSILTDRKGYSLFCGGDVELGNALRLAGYKLWYDERLVFKHFIPKERLTWEYILQSTKGSGQSDISAAVFYFIFRNPELRFSRFKYLYYKRLVWLLLQILKQPKNLFFYLANKSNSNHLGIIEINRNLANLISSFKHRKLAFSVYHNINLVKQKLELPS